MYHKCKLGVIRGAEFVHHSGAPEFTPGFQWDSSYSILIFYVMFCKIIICHLCPISFCYCTVYSPLIYGFCLPISYLQYFHELMFLSICILCIIRTSNFVLHWNAFRIGMQQNDLMKIE